LPSLEQYALSALAGAQQRHPDFNKQQTKHLTQFHTSQN